MKNIIKIHEFKKVPLHVSYAKGDVRAVAPNALDNYRQKISQLHASIDRMDNLLKDLKALAKDS